ncbi:MAG: hypothetical protein DRP11_03015 [Candidatus Aenigmatarchaeota archaeon]|nr:MAG: hypothetical protein DRP11_03015 [Candidatus Aenigmarchaeota archaeon]
MIDTRRGPVIIMNEVEVFPYSRIEGPVYIGSNSSIGKGDNAIIHEGTHIGRVCNIGGEIEESIIHSFTNKYHYGFFGHGVAGSWVNFGAGTTNSDLKNTYGKVNVKHPVEGLIKDVGLKIGCTVGDHTKFSIGVMIHTGKQIGPLCNVMGAVRDDLDPFTWYEDGVKKKFRVSKTKEVARRMMERRKKYLPSGYIEAEIELIDRLGGCLEG